MALSVLIGPAARDALCDRIAVALAEVARRAEGHVEDIDEWIETAASRLVTVPRVDEQSTPESLRFDVYVDLGASRAPLLSVLARDLVAADGSPVDAAELVRELRWQLGEDIPDDLSGL